MPGAVVDILAIVAALVCLRAPVRTQAIVVLGALFLIPDAVHLTVGPSYSLLRVVLWATTAGLVLHARRGDLPWSALRPGRVHLALATFVVAAYVVGVSWAPWPADFHAGFNLWLTLVDQLLFLSCVVTIARTQGIRWVATALVAIVTIDAGIGIAERVTSGSYSHWWYLHQGRQALATVGGPLERRGTTASSVRVRANAEFALQYGWVLAMVTPLACAVALERSRWPQRPRAEERPQPRRVSAFWIAPPMIVAATVLTVSRSVFVGLGAAAAVWVVLSRFDRRVLALCGAAALGVAALLGLAPSLRHPYHQAFADSVQSRVRRQQVVAAAVVPRPLTGVGLVGLSTYGIAGTDSYYVFTYGTLGVVGLIGLIGTFIVSMVVAADAALRDRSLLPSAAAAGVVAGLIAAGAFDSLSGATSAWPLWMLVAIAVVAHEQAVPGGVTPSPVRVAAPVAGVLLGLAASAAFSPRVTTFSTFSAIDARFLAPNLGDPSYAGSVVANTVCNDGAAAVRALPVKVVCDSRAGPGLGYVQVSAADRARVDAALTRFDAAAVEVAAPYRRTVVTRFDAKSTAARTAPVWLGGGGLMLAVFIPRLRRRRVGGAR